ncbi:CLUMA_CG002186, isoform A [Clunio marinus]|uniref:CLUMA_CG002186, isoform A n=1 Tax=Clunio marinus TaxID=568069 RepID=A0A1J1HKG4_9DIPT|nr:CLUMA_CG002186, isoform A [Clunio marinus]
MRYSHFIIITFVLISITRCEEKKVEDVDKIIYQNIETILKTDYPNDSSKVDCLLGELKKQKTADKVYTEAMLLDKSNKELKEKIEPYVVEAEKICKQKNAGSIFHTSISMLILCAIAGFIRA